jgi:hypothetical protein
VKIKALLKPRYQFTRKISHSNDTKLKFKEFWKEKWWKMRFFSTTIILKKDSIFEEN